MKCRATIVFCAIQKWQLSLLLLLGKIPPAKTTSKTICFRSFNLSVLGFLLGPKTHIFFTCIMSVLRSLYNGQTYTKWEPSPISVKTTILAHSSAAGTGFGLYLCPFSISTSWALSLFKFCLSLHTCTSKGVHSWVGKKCVHLSGWYTWNASDSLTKVTTILQICCLQVHNCGSPCVKLPHSTQTYSKQCAMFTIGLNVESSSRQTAKFTDQLMLTPRSLEMVLADPHLQSPWHLVSFMTYWLWHTLQLTLIQKLISTKSCDHVLSAGVFAHVCSVH